MELIKYLGLRWWLALTLAPVACAPTPTSSSGTDINAYEEDLARYRTSMVDTMEMALDTLRQQPNTTTASREVPTSLPTTHDKTQAVAELLDSISAYNGRIPSVEGYTVLVFSGTNRERAMLTQREVEALGYAPKLEYSRPNFKVKVGRFTDQLEARRMQLLLQQNFRMAIIVPERIKLN